MGDMIPASDGPPCKGEPRITATTSVSNMTAEPTQVEPPTGYEFCCSACGSGHECYYFVPGMPEASVG